MVRLKHSVEDLLYTSDNLFQIAIKNGFSTAKNFSLAFKSEYEQTPAQYRKEHQNEKLEKQEARTGKIETKQVLESPEALIRLAQYLEDSANKVCYRMKCRLKNVNHCREMRSGGFVGTRKAYFVYR